MIDLAELETKARAATQGQWSVEPHGSTRALYAGRNNERHGLRLLNLDDGDRNIAANAAYIAAAQPRVVLELIDRVRAAEAKAGEPVALETCPSCNGSGLQLNSAGEPDDCRECKGDTVVCAAPPDVSALQKRVRVLEEALQKIERWFGAFPPTGRTWPDGTPTSYATEYGSNGERDFMRSVARKALGGSNE
jgi:hypothetical protein